MFIVQEIKVNKTGNFYMILKIFKQQLDKKMLKSKYLVCLVIFADINALYAG